VTFFEPEHLRQLTGGRWRQAPPRPLTLSGVGIDTRQPLAGRMFFAIRGAHHDGHDFLDEAVAAEAALLVVEREILPEALPAVVGVLEVPDTRQALAQLAAAYRRTLTGTTVIAVTGSAGKTTTKMLLHGVLSAVMQGSAAPKSFNNEIGVPLTLLAADADDRYLVVEVGSSTPGETAMLTRIVEPDIAVITTIGRAHLSGLGSVAQVAREKSALVRGLSRSACASAWGG
jgi:UDP-N-acetylmuramoyl-tripeptide--D-alanyl-D-alanine ligase